MPLCGGQTSRVDKTPEKTLAENLLWLKDSTPDLDSQAKIAAKAGIDQTTVGRILRAQNYPTLDKITALAKAFKVEAWQLLAPNLGAGPRAVHAAPASDWPLRRISRDRWQHVDDWQKGAMEEAALRVLKEFESAANEEAQVAQPVQSRKRQATGE